VATGDRTRLLRGVGEEVVGKRKGGNPRNSGGGGRVATKPTVPCVKRSIYEGREMPCLHTSSMKVGGGPRIKMCSWCGARPGKAPNNRTIPKKLSHNRQRAKKVPDSRFSDEEPVVAVPVREWQALQHQGLAAWPLVAQQEFLRSLNNE